MALTYGTATFTNGQQAVTSVSLDSGTLTYFQAGTEIAVGANPQIATVEAQKATGASSFNLKEPWPYPSGTYAFLASNTSEAFANGIQAAKGFQDALQAAVDGQGTAASRDVQNSSTDTTAGRVLTVGAGGLLGSGEDKSDARDLASKTHYWKSGPDPANLPQINSNWVGQTIYRSDTTAAYIAFALTRERVFYETLNASWNGVKEFWTEGNLISDKNASGSSVASDAIVSGSALESAPSGSWRNVTGNTIANNAGALWMKV